MNVIILIFVCYLLGSIPFSFIFGLVRGIDLRKVGSGNLGATNTMRVLGTTAGIIVFILDAAKGAVAVVIGMKLAPNADAASWWGMTAGLIAMFGHNYSVWVRFHGGRGVSTGLGTVLVLSPIAACLGFAIFVIVVGLTRYVSLGSILGVLAALLLLLLWRQNDAQLVLIAAAAIFIIWRHLANIKRLLAGTESRFGQRAK